MARAMLAWSKTFGGRPDSALTQFAENMETGKVYPDCGADDSQAHCFLKAIPVTCLYAGQPQRAAKVEEAIRIHQNNEMAVTYGLAASAILESILLGGTLAEALKQVPDGEARKNLEKGANFAGGDLEALLLEMSHELMKDQPDSPFYDHAGRSCALPGSFVAPAYLLAHPSGPPDFATAVRQNILGAGDTCSRGIFLGGILGDSLPESWVNQVHRPTMERIDAAASKIADWACGESPRHHGAS